MKVENDTQLSPPVGAKDHSRGSHMALVTLVEYGDFECPYCGRAYPIVKELERRAGDLVRVIFRNFPLTNLHPHAELAAQAAEAAGAQGQFWPMHDVIFEHQSQLDRASLETYAEGIDLDLERFRSELDAGVWAERVREHFLSGVRSGVNGTPTFFINGRRHDGGYQLDELMAAVVDASQ